MTEISFHVNAPDKAAYACRLLRKAVASGSKVAVTGEAGLLRQLDVALWTFAPLEFIPHCMGTGITPEVLAASPVVLTDSVRTVPHQQVLVNLGAGVPEGFERFERLIEVVAADDADLQQGRRRWKHYADRGYAVTKHEVATKEAQ